MRPHLWASWWLTTRYSDKSHKACSLLHCQLWSFWKMSCTQLTSIFWTLIHTLERCMSNNQIQYHRTKSWTYCWECRVGGMGSFSRNWLHSGDKSFKIWLLKINICFKGFSLMDSNHRITLIRCCFANRNHQVLIQQWQQLLISKTPLGLHRLLVNSQNHLVQAVMVCLCLQCRDRSSAWVRKNKRYGNL